MTRHGGGVEFRPPTTMSPTRFTLTIRRQRGRVLCRRGQGRREARKGIIIKQKPEYVPGVRRSPYRSGFIRRTQRLKSSLRRHVPFAPMLACPARDGKFEAMFAYYRDIVRPKFVMAATTAGVRHLGRHLFDGDVTVQPTSNQPTGMHHFGLEVQDEADMVAEKRRPQRAASNRAQRRPSSASRGLHPGPGRLESSNSMPTATGGRDG